MSDKTPLPQTALPSTKKGFLFKALLGIIILLLLLIAGLWLWSGSQSSFATAISFAQSRLPVKSLTVSDAQASLRNGGHIGNIHIEQNDGSSITLYDVNIDWNLLGLLHKQLTIQQLSVQKVHFMPTSALPPTPASEETSQQEPVPSTSNQPAPAPQPPEQVLLPIQLDLKQLQIAHVVSGKDEQEVASNIQLSYHYDGTQHALQLESAHLADGAYQGSATLTALHPQLNADLKGILTTQVPQSDQNITIHANATINGPLTLLDVKANAQAATGQTANNSNATLQASVAPWAMIKIPEADLALQAFNTQAFWTQAPQTLLSGTVKVSTSAQSPSDQEKTLIALNLKNAVPGAIDLSKIPVSSIVGTLTAQSEHVTFNELDLRIGSGTAIITGSAQLPQVPHTNLTWQTHAKLASVDPHIIYSQLASDHLSGTVNASTKSANAIGFDANITAAKGSNIPHFKVKQLVANGTFFMGDRVVLNTVTAHSVDAQIHGQNISYSLKGGAVSGPLQLTAPGLKATASLGAFAKTSGSAKISLNVHSADKAAPWLRKQPINLGSLVDFLDKAAHYTENLVNYTQDIPILINGGWEHPQVTLQLDMNALIAKIIETEGKNKLLDHLGLPQKPQTNEQPRQQVEREVINRLGDLLNHSRK